MRRRRLNSLRARLIAGLLAGVTVFLAASGIAIYWVVRARMLAEIDRSLVELAQSNMPPLVRELGFRPFVENGRPARPDRRPPQEAERGPRAFAQRAENALPALPEREDLLFQVWREDGATGMHSQRLAGRSLPRLGAGVRPVELDAVEPDALEFASFELDPPPAGEGREWRGVGARFRPPGLPASSFPPRPPRQPPPIEVVFAKDVSGLSATLASLRWLLALAWLSSSAGCAAILSFVVHRGLRPLRRLDRQLAELDARRLDRRFEVDGLPDELVPVVRQLNGTLARIGEAFEREQAFSAYAAHELRTPLAGLRSTLEVSLARARPAEEHREAEAACLAITRELEQLVERLLELSRAGALEPELGGAPVPLAERVDAAWAPHAAEAARRSLAFARDVPPGLAVRTDARLLDRVLDNLLENAVAYADAGGLIRVRAEGGEEAWSLAISNPAQSAPPELAARAFDAFWRADAARAETGRHAGLGLALCKRIVERMGGEIEAALEGGRFTVRVRVPPMGEGSGGDGPS